MNKEWVSSNGPSTLPMVLCMFILIDGRIFLVYLNIKDQNIIGLVLKTSGYSVAVSG